ncbi:hypothetical protein V1478_017833 [Vespula squamosa]|uniref:Uncharacterized protein n=1 Tax=Vespula squamosa TaxID=30214 RepID=A0ABD1ZXW5_VESSQ
MRPSCANEHVQESPVRGSSAKVELMDRTPQCYRSLDNSLWSSVNIPLLIVQMRAIIIFDQGKGNKGRMLRLYSVVDAINGDD